MTVMKLEIAQFQEQNMFSVYETLNTFNSSYKKLKQFNNRIKFLFLFLNNQ